MLIVKPETPFTRTNTAKLARKLIKTTLDSLERYDDNYVKVKLIVDIKKIKEIVSELDDYPEFVREYRKEYPNTVVFARSKLR